jgi:replicative DNA helicase
MAFDDPAAETAVLAGVARYGRDAFVDCEGIVEPSIFTDEVNQCVWACLEDFHGKGEERPIDYPSLISTAKKLGYGEMFGTSDIKRHIRTLFNYPIDLETVSQEAAKLYRLSITKELDARLAEIRKDLKNVTGDEKLDEITNRVESPILEYIQGIGSGQGGTHQIAQGIDEWLNDVLDNPRENIGIPTPFPIFNTQLGGGLRRKVNSVLGGRMKQGKTVFMDNCGLHIAGVLNIPVLNVDTEMSAEDHWARILGHLSGIPYSRIERGALTTYEKVQIREHAEWLKNIPYYYRSVIDESFEEQIATMRRWVIKTVGQTDGVTNPALIMYDYIQEGDASEYKGNFKEHQVLGFCMLGLGRLIKRHDVAMLSGVQLNRDGLSREDMGVIAGSDRIGRKAGSVSMIKKKSPDDIARDGPENGNLKLKVLVARHGPGCEENDHINLKFEGANAKLTEIGTHLELQKNRKPSNERSFASEDEDEPWAAA